MRTSSIRLLGRWTVPVALFAVSTAGCTTVGGSAAGGGPVVPSSISVVAPSVEPTTEPLTEPDAPSSTSSAGVPDPASSEVSESPSTGPGGGTPGASVTSDTAADPPSSAAPRTMTGNLLNLTKFWSPSRNIGCLIEDGLSVRCDLAESDITEQHDCGDGGDWGQAIGLDRGRKAEMLCASDTVMDPDAPVLAYGSSTRVGSMTCTSSEDGMACSDDLGHGFRLSRSSYDVR